MYCIYRITNLINGKTYIGQHKYSKLNDSYKGSGRRLWEAYRKYGIENFKKEILIFNVLKKEHIDLLEKTFITSEREKIGAENCYNIADGGQGGNGSKGKPNLYRKGKHISEEQKRKISEANKGRKLSEEHRRKISEFRKGRSHPHKGVPRSEEARKRLSESHKGKHWKLVDGKRVYY